MLLMLMMVNRVEELIRKRAESATGPAGGTADRPIRRPGRKIRLIALHDDKYIVQYDTPYIHRYLGETLRLRRRVDLGRVLSSRVGIIRLLYTPTAQGRTSYQEEELAPSLMH